MFKRYLHELAERGVISPPSYGRVIEGSGNGLRFKAYVEFNHEIFMSPTYSTTLREAEHDAAFSALTSLSSRYPSNSSTAEVLNEIGVHRNLLREAALTAGLNMPRYSTVRSGRDRSPVFTGTVRFGGRSFDGQPARTREKAEKNAAFVAWSALGQAVLVKEK